MRYQISHKLELMIIKLVTYLAFDIDQESYDLICGGLIIPAQF